MEPHEHTSIGIMEGQEVEQEVMERWLYGPLSQEPLPPRLWVLRETVYTLRRLVVATQTHQQRKCPRARVEVLRLLADLEELRSLTSRGRVG